MARTVHDRNGDTVTVGTPVRVLGLSGPWLDSLPDGERMDVLSMVGQVLEVDEIDEYGQAWVVKEWARDGGVVESHSVALSGAAMEVLAGYKPGPMKSWRLMHEGVSLGQLTFRRMDEGSWQCVFDPTAPFSAVIHLFEDGLAVFYDEGLEMWVNSREITELGLVLTPDDGSEAIGGFLINIVGTHAWFRLDAASKP